jgi:hypothetical protein
VATNKEHSRDPEILKRSPERSEGSAKPTDL